MTYDPSDPVSVEEEQAFRAARGAHRKEAWLWLVRDPRGRTVLADILLATGVDDQTFVPGQADLTAYNEGRRAVGLSLRRTISLNYAEFVSDIENQLRELVHDGGSGGESG